MSTVYYDPILNVFFLDHGLIVEHDGTEFDGEMLMLGDDEREEFFMGCINLGELG